jgi:hypothetical protein
MNARQVEREGATAADPTDHANFTAEQSRNFATDREAKTRAAVFSAGSAVGLLKCFEDDSLFFRRDADAGIVDRERYDLAGPVQ